ncbi:MAG: DUF2141 domain-containing protein [Sphaerospermopsis sp. SIO1G1]|nr:DUF2141 domain-containing protein [Sphaerospermopsis sp. SIO1G1]
MFNIHRFSCLSLVTLLSLFSANNIHHAYAETNSDLTVIVNGIRNQTGEICIGVHNSAQGFPDGNSSQTKSACTPITGNTVKQVFTNLKPGNYAVVVLDDQNGDRRLNKDFFGIPTEGFGISKNPIVSIQTGTPKFHHVSFKLNKNTTININMKYSLDS